MYPTKPSPDQVILVGIVLERDNIEETKAHMEELRKLALTRGLDPVAEVIQRRKKFCASTKIGKGKVEEIAAMITCKHSQSVLFDDELTPGQVKNLERKLGCRVWDRTLLILEIFAMHARTVQAKTQVSLAQYQYLLPRLTRMWTHLSRQGGGGKGAGMQGTGEKELETDRRIVQRKIHLLKEKLAAITRQAAIRRTQRKQHVNVALVGYTNAGKSTLMQRLAKVSVLVEDKLFATLTTTVRKVVLHNIPFLLADTVGFIRKLPHTLIACFKSTLSEVCEADILLHVVDYAHPQFDKQISIVTETLQEIGADKIPVILVLNKVDRLEKLRSFASLEEVEKHYSAQYNMPVVCIAATQGHRLEKLREVIYKQVAEVHQKRYPHNKTDLQPRSSMDRIEVS